MCIVNLQHDCASSECKLTASPVWQERIQTNRTRSTILHSPTNKFILNAYSIHNYQHILPLIPPQLRNPAPMVPNADEVHRQAAKHIRNKKDTRNVCATVAPTAHPSITINHDSASEPVNGTQDRPFARPAFKRPPPSKKEKKGTRAKPTKTKTNGMTVKGKGTAVSFFNQCHHGCTSCCLFHLSYFPADAKSTGDLLTECPDPYVTLG